VEASPTYPERHLLAELCTLLPELRERAEQGLWSDELDQLVGEVAAGGSAAAVFRQLGLLVGRAEALRGAEPPGVDGAHLPGLAEVRLTGDYRCPSARCTRRDRRDDRGRAPVCALDDKPMVYRSGA
jgi:hypothetical protein